MAPQSGALSIAIHRFLRVVTGGGPGSAATANDVAAPQDDFSFGFDTETAGLRGKEVVIRSATGRRGRFLLGLAFPIVAVVVLLKLTGSQADTPNAKPVINPEPPVAPTLAPRVSTGSGFRSYAIEVTELEGLPPNATSGTRLEIWVTWEPPLTAGIKVQRLIRAAQLESIVPPVVPEAPATALLSVRAKDIPDLLYGDRFGALSVSLMPGS